MTTNEQIIIDGVDVSGCSGFSNNPEDVKTGQTCWYYTEYVHDNEWGTRCPEHPNCEYKQLQRKTAECEELQKLCQNRAKTINDLTGCVSLWEEFSEEESELAKNSSIADLVVLLREARSSLESKTSECEELKEKYEEIKEDRYNLNMEMYTLDRYRKALEEIESIAIKNQRENFYYDGMNELIEITIKLTSDYTLILDIINKAKGGENG